jgi:hypothetical protein
MLRHRNQFLLLNWIFILGLILLALNDHYFKWHYSNSLTGKISDFTGLLIFPMFLQFVFPRLRDASAAITGLLFVFWKLPFSERFIKLYNHFSFIPITRTVDYSDLIALSILPVSHLLINRIDAFKINTFPGSVLSQLFIVVPACFVFMATSPPISFYMQAGGDIHIGKTFKMKMSKEKVLEKLQAQGYTVRLDTTPSELIKPKYYLIENVVLPGVSDTIKSIQIGFMGTGDKSLLLLNNVSLKGDTKISDWRKLKRFSKFYQKLIGAEIIREIK